MMEITATETTMGMKLSVRKRVESRPARSISTARMSGSTMVAGTYIRVKRIVFQKAPPGELMVSHMTRTG